MRTLVLAAGVLLVLVLAAFLAVSKWRNPFNLHDIPKRLGIDIQQEANGVTYTQARGGHTLFKIHASKVVQLKNDQATLHDVQIELYSADGKSVDRIQGNEFEYDQKAGTATAAGPVQIWLTRPSVAPAIAPTATPDQAMKGKPGSNSLAGVAHSAAAGEIHVETSGLTFDQKSDIVTTSQKVTFSMTQGKGSSVGAIYNAQLGTLVLSRAVELNTLRGADPVEIHAQHAEFERTRQICSLQAATVETRGEQATAGQAKVQFRSDGSVERLDATGGFTLATDSGGHLASPTATLAFDTSYQPQHGRLQGGVQMDAVNAGRQVHGAAPTLLLEFGPQGQLRHAHLERGVELRSEELDQPGVNARTAPLRVTRTWRSPVADVDFRDAGHGQMEPARISGSGGVTINEESRRGKEKPVPAKLAADTMTGAFGPNSVLTALTGNGHASLEQITASGARQVASGDQLQASFAASQNSPRSRVSQGGAAQVQSALLQGHVVLVEQAAAKPGEAAPLPMQATAGRADYESTGEWLHLTQSPRVDDGGMQMTADKIDVSQTTGDAFAHGNVKATWQEAATNNARGAVGAISLPLGGEGPAHVIAAEAQLRQSTGEATFRGHARLWQQANSISAPLIMLNQKLQTLEAHSTNTAEPVRTVLSSATANAANTAHGNPSAKPGQPQVIRVRGGDLRYSSAEHKALMNGGALDVVVAEAGTATSSSSQVELTLLPPGKRTGKYPAQGAVDRMTARGHVVVSSQGRRGTGEQLTYTSATGEYVLTGTAAAPPRLTDPARGSVTGQALIFSSRDDSVSIEGGGRETTTQTTAPK